MTHPMRSLTTSIKTVFPDSPVISVRTDGEIEKNMLLAVSMLLRDILVQSRVKIGDIIAENICDTGVNIICTSDRLTQSH
jgi:CxxC motif-containing protein